MVYVTVRKSATYKANKLVGPSGSVGTESGDMLDYRHTGLGTQNPGLQDNTYLSWWLYEKPVHDDPAKNVARLIINRLHKYKDYRNDIRQGMGLPRKGDRGLY